MFARERTWLAVVALAMGTWLGGCIEAEPLAENEELLELADEAIEEAESVEAWPEVKENEVTPLGTGDCDTKVWDKYVEVKPWNYAGRKIVIMTGKAFETSYAKIASGYQNGDRVWYDRRNEDDTGHRQCGPFSGKESGAQDHRNANPWGQKFKLRSCIDPAGPVGFKCGAWHLGQNL